MISAPVALLLLSATVPLTISSIVVHYTSSGGVCSGVCGYHGYGYTWCKKSDGSWDYCSLEPGVEVTGKRCATSCDFWGASYRHCYLGNGNWNYCGLLGQREVDQYSQDNNICINSCRATRDYFRCRTVKGNEHCSPFRDVTPKGFPCHNNYRCAKYGHDVHRCHIGYSEATWDYCGQKSLDMCVWVKRSSATEICTLPRSQKEGPIIFRRQLRNSKTFANTQFQKAVLLIDEINSITSFPDYGHLARAYFYKRESVFCGGINYTNVELKMSCLNQTSVPVAHVLFPENLSSVEILRLAFYTSLHSSFYLPAYTIVVSVGKPMQCSTEPMI
ncbi:hypothetical protein lerEdw1_015364 [Lerista edwardsae]|nr:hypothetical protein lerEdw1_015364 [Lerista edwardsae]